MKIEFEKLILEQIILETRFADGYLYWDHCGRIWKTIFEKWPDFKEVKVSPEIAVFKLHDDALELKLSPYDIHLSQNFPSSLKLFKEVAKEAIPLIANTLEIKTFTRIGNRIIYLHPTAALEEAGDIVKSMGLLNIPSDKIKPFGDTLDEPQVRFKIQNEDVGYRFSLAAISRKLSIEIPKPLKVDSSGFVPNAVLIDVDYFTRKTVDLSIIDFEDLVNTVQKNLKHNFTKLFG